VETELGVLSLQAYSISDSLRQGLVSRLEQDLVCLPVILSVVLSSSRMWELIRCFLDDR
jgi:hypothetical protein